MEPRFNIRPARPDEAGLVLEFIKRLADYEKCADEVVADEATIRQSLFVEHSAEVVFAEEDGVAIGFALFFHNFSTFVGRKGLYLEDMFIIPEKRGRGYGKALLKYLARTAVERNCGRIERIPLHRRHTHGRVDRPETVGDSIETIRRQRDKLTLTVQEILPDPDTGKSNEAESSYDNWYSCCKSGY